MHGSKAGARSEFHSGEERERETNNNNPERDCRGDTEDRDNPYMCAGANPPGIIGSRNNT